MQPIRFGAVHQYKNFSELQQSLQQSVSTKAPSYVAVGQKPGQPFSYAKLDGEEGDTLAYIEHIFTGPKADFTTTGKRNQAIPNVLKKLKDPNDLNMPIDPFLNFFQGKEKISENIREGLNLNYFEEDRLEHISNKGPLTLESAVRAFMVQQMEPDVFFKILMSCLIQKMTGLRVNLTLPHNFCRTDQLSGSLEQTPSQSSVAEKAPRFSVDDFENPDEPLGSWVS